MSVSAQETVFYHVGNGVTVTFAFNCQVLQAADLRVYVDDALITSGFTTSGIGASTGGSITFNSAPANAASIRLEREVTLERTTDYQQNGDFLARVVNPDFNRLWMALQQHRSAINYSFRVPKSDPAGLAELPRAAVRANNLLSFDANGNPVAVAAAAQSATALTIQLAAPLGASKSGFLQAGDGAVQRDMLEKGREWISPEDYGATGIGDDTIAIQKALFWAATTRRWLNGGGKTYKVSKVFCYSGQRVRSLYLESIGPLAAGPVSFQSVVEINGLTAVKSDMIFDDVRVNGRRDLFPYIDVTLGEDGGMHAWRVVANAAGGVRDITWINCEGINAGSAGLAIHSPNPATGVGGCTYPIKNLKWSGGKLTGNREHGWFADAFDGLAMLHVDCRYNGLDLNTTDPAVHGNRAFRSGPYLFGSAFDVESYGPDLVGSLWRNLTVDDLDCRACAMPAQMYNPIATNVAGYMPHSGIHIDRSKFDKGTAAGADRAPNTNYSFNVLGNLVGTSYPYTDMPMAGNFFDGAPQFNGVKALSVSGGYINAASIKSHVFNCLNWEITANASSAGLDIFPVPAVVFTKSQGSAGAVVATQNLIRTKVRPGGDLFLHIEGTITGGLNADGDLIYTTVSPIPGMFITEMDVSASAPIGVAVATANSISAGGIATMWFDTVNGSTIFYKVVLVLSVAG